jgi:hypothetical protein
MSKLLAAGTVQAVDIGDSVSDGLSTVARFVPRFVGFLIILVIGYIVAKMVAKLADKVLERIGFDRLVERGGIGKALERSTYDASDLVAKLIYYALLLITLQLAFSVFGPNPVSELISGVVAWIPKAVVAIVIVVVAAAIARAAKDLVSNALAGVSYGPLLGTIASVFILALGVIAALNQIGVATTVTMPVLIAALATVAGILIVGVGGGMVRPMQDRWARWLDRAEAESTTMRQQAAAYQRGREDATTATATPQPAETPAPTPPPATEQPTVQQPYRGTP